MFEQFDRATLVTAVLAQIYDYDSHLDYKLRLNNSNLYYYYIRYLSQEERQKIYNCIPYVQAWLVLGGWNEEKHTRTKLLALCQDFMGNYDWNVGIRRDVENIKTIRKKERNQRKRQLENKDA